MKATRILIPFVLSMASLALAQDVTGDWHGTLSVNGAELRLVLHISKNSDGSLKATLDSIDQNANGIPVTSATLRGSALSLKVDAVHGWYEGKVDAAGSEIAGTWTQGAPLELTFHRGGIPAEAAAKRATRNLGIGLSIRAVVSEPTTRQLTGRFRGCECNGDVTPVSTQNSGHKRDSNRNATPNSDERPHPM